MNHGLFIRYTSRKMENHGLEHDIFRPVMEGGCRSHWVGMQWDWWPAVYHTHHIYIHSFRTVYTSLAEEIGNITKSQLDETHVNIPSGFNQFTTGGKVNIWDLNYISSWPEASGAWRRISLHGNMCMARALQVHLTADVSMNGETSMHWHMLTCYIS